MAWAFGETVVFRDVWNRRVTFEMPARVVEDNDARVVLWWPVGTVGRLFDEDDRLEFLRRRYSDEPLALAPKTWHTTDLLQVMPIGAPYSLWLFRDADRKHVGWYCNLQAPFTRAADGFETWDWTLDVWAGDDLSYWLYKDEAELEWGLENGVFDAAFVDQVRAAGRSVVELIERRDPIFDGWADWEPPADWTTPVLPAV
jgi:hypothetical protein